LVHSLLTTIPPTPTSTLFPYTTLFRSQMNLSHYACFRVGTHMSHTLAMRLRVYRQSWSSSLVLLSFLRFLAHSRFQRPCILFFRSEEHTSELQSRENLVCRLLLEKKKY